MSRDDVQIEGTDRIMLVDIDVGLTPLRFGDFNQTIFFLGERQQVGRFDEETFHSKTVEKLRFAVVIIGQVQCRVGLQRVSQANVTFARLAFDGLNALLIVEMGHDDGLHVSFELRGTRRHVLAISEERSDMKLCHAHLICTLHAVYNKCEEEGKGQP